jgi:lysophospholipid acyltransferase (LPLAT)-like uncharacterized protein
MKRRIVAFVLDLVARTWRLRVRGMRPSSGVVAFWHGQMLPVWAIFARQNAIALVSPSRDGDVLAALLERWGYQIVRGSSSRGGRQALETLIEHARAGRLVLITPDGPRGPRGVVKRGAVVCAQQAQVPLVWCSVRCRWAFRSQRSWDRFLLPLPFATVEITIAPALDIPPTLESDDIAQLCTELQTRYAPTD